MEMVHVIEWLMDLEHPCKDPRYHEWAEQIVQLKQNLDKQLNQEGISQLAQMMDAYARQEDAVLREAFTDGFCAAVELMLELYRNRMP